MANLASANRAKHFLENSLSDKLAGKIFSGELSFIPGLSSPCEPLETLENKQETLKTTEEFRSKKSTKETKHKGKEGQVRSGNKGAFRLLG